MARTSPSRIRRSASTMLVVIVMMLGMLFQQTSTAWRTGLLRTGGYMQLRSYIGAIQRDASAMIDANQLPEEMLCGGQKQQFNSGMIQFYTMTGSDKNRTLNFITHDLNGNREQRVLWFNGTWKSPDGNTESAQSDILPPEPGQSESSLLVTPEQFVATYSDEPQYDRAGRPVSSAANKFPLYLTVDATIKQKGELFEVGAESAGPDMEFGKGPDDPKGRDDIRTWVQ